MVFPNRNIITQKRDLFAVIGSIIAVTTLATSGAATQLAFAPGGSCTTCRLSALGEGSINCADTTTTYTSTISISAIKGKGGTASGTLTISTDSGLTATGTITGGKISLAKYSLKGTWDPNGICGATGPTPFSTSGPTGTSVPINFKSSAIASSGFMGTAQTTTPT